MERLASRKFMLATFALLSADALMWFGKISDGVFSTIMIAAVASYITGNVIEGKQTHGG